MRKKNKIKNKKQRVLALVLSLWLEWKRLNGQYCSQPFMIVWNDIGSFRWPFNDWCYTRFSKPILNLTISVIEPLCTVPYNLFGIKKQSRTCLFTTVHWYGLALSEMRKLNVEQEMKGEREREREGEELDTERGRVEGEWEREYNRKYK